jgi:hypothetical protein
MSMWVMYFLFYVLTSVDDDISIVYSSRNMAPHGLVALAYSRGTAWWCRQAPFELYRSASTW